MLDDVLDVIVEGNDKAKHRDQGKQEQEQHAAPDKDVHGILSAELPERRGGLLHTNHIPFRILFLRIYLNCIKTSCVCK